MLIFDCSCLCGGDSKTKQETIPNLFLQAWGFADDLSSIKKFTVRVIAIYNQSSVCVFLCLCFFFYAHMLHGAGTFTLWLFNIAMEHGPFIDGLPIENGGSFP